MHIPRGGQISPDLSFTSLRVLVGSVPRSALVLGRPGPSGPRAALVAARSDLALEMEDAGPFTDRDPWSGTAAPLRHASPDVLPMSAVSAREPDGAHAIG